MDYRYLVRQYYKQRKKKGLTLLTLTRLNLRVLSAINWVNGLTLKSIMVFLGFQFDIYMKLKEVTGDPTYELNAQAMRYQIEITMNALGE